MSQQKEIVSTINGLIETLKDGQQGFREASEAVKDAQRWIAECPDAG